MKEARESCHEGANLGQSDVTGQVARVMFLILIMKINN